MSDDYENLITQGEGILEKSKLQKQNFSGPMSELKTATASLHGTLAALQVWEKRAK